MFLDDDVNLRNNQNQGVNRESYERQNSENNMQLRDFYLYDEPSNYSTPSALTPLFNNAQSSEYSSIHNRSLAPSPLRTTNNPNNSNESSLDYSSSVYYQNYQPYALSGNGTLPNAPFERVNPIHGNIPLGDGFIRNRNLPLIQSNSPTNDPCSLQYVSRNRGIMTNQEIANTQADPTIYPISQEIELKG